MIQYFLGRVLWPFIRLLILQTANSLWILFTVIQAKATFLEKSSSFMGAYVRAVKLSTIKYNALI